MIKFENVVFGYGEEKNALNYVSFHISEGEQVGLIGANGAGKSTLCLLYTSPSPRDTR